MTAKNKREIHQLILKRRIDIVIGTHAIIQKDVEFKKLGFIVVDEQHRFGVAQRSTLRQKGTNPMCGNDGHTYTKDTRLNDLRRPRPIGHDELPPGRQLIKTKWLQPDQRKCLPLYP